MLVAGRGVRPYAKNLLRCQASGLTQPGRDHGPRGTSLPFAGGGLETGQVIGGTDRCGEVVVERRISVHEFLATVYRHLDVDPRGIAFNDFAGRPVPILNQGKPILAQRVIGWYERRWMIEEYHNALKTGCQIEDLQFTSGDRLQTAVALLSAVALTLLNLRDASRRADAQTRRATTLFAREYVEVLSIWRHRRLRIDLTAHDFFLALARLGGHQNRKHDSRPGWLVLWRGWIKLQLLLDGYEAAKHRKCGET